MSDDGEAELLSELLEFRGSGLGSLAETEVFALMDFYGFQRLPQDLVGKIEGGEP